MRWIAAAALLLSACNGGTTWIEPAEQDDAELRAAAREIWAAVGVATPVDYTLLFLDPDALADACHADLAALQLVPGAGVGGCSFPGVVLLNAQADAAEQLGALVHELGHLERDDRRNEHLDCAAANHGAELGADVMCLTGAGAGALPTARDAAFVSRR